MTGSRIKGRRWPKNSDDFDNSVASRGKQWRNQRRLRVRSSHKERYLVKHRVNPEGRTNRPFQCFVSAERLDRTFVNRCWTYRDNHYSREKSDTRIVVPFKASIRHTESGFSSPFLRLISFSPGGLYARYTSEKLGRGYTGTSFRSSIIPSVSYGVLDLSL